MSIEVKKLVLVVECPSCGSRDVRVTDGETHRCDDGFIDIDTWECNRCGEEFSVTTSAKGNKYTMLVEISDSRKG